MRWFFFLSAVLLLSFGCTKPNKIDWDKVFGDKDAAASSDDDSVAGDDLQPDETLPDDLTDEEVTDETGEEETPDEEEDTATEEEPDSADIEEPEGDEPDPVDDEEITDTEEETPEGEEEVGDDATAPDDDLVDDMVEADAWEADIVEADTVDEDIVPDLDVAKVICSGQDKCYNNIGEMICPIEGNDFYGQDAQYASWGYCIPRDYTISGTSGNDIVIDNVTGLEWQRAVLTTKRNWSDAISYCQDMVYAGYDDWRLPARDELATLPDYSISDPAVDLVIFPGTSFGYFWTSSPDANDAARAWGVDLGDGDVATSSKTGTLYARCVRGNSLSPSVFTEVNIGGDIVVKDVVKGLIWTKEYAGPDVWKVALSHCENLNYGGFSDWRLPNTEEMMTLIDHTVYDPSSIFPDMPSYSFWSSSSYAGNEIYAWFVSLQGGVMSLSEKGGNYYIRCVRSNICGDGIVLDAEQCDDGNDIDDDACSNNCIADPVPILCTGQTKCYDGTVEITCPTTGNDFYGQDAQYAALGYCTPRSYSISGTAGNDIVTDNVTGLIWQRTVNATTYTWANAITYCENLNYGVQTDWRLPTRKELATLPDYGRYNPAIDTTIFPGTESEWYWSSSSNMLDTTYAWNVYFITGPVISYDKTHAYYARCVRGDTLPDSIFAESSVSGKVIVTDTATGLIWTKEDSGTVTWQNALSYCENLDYGEATDWRLPNIEELKTLIDDTIYSPASTFPGMPTGYFWSSSSNEGYTTYAWSVNFNDGGVGSYGDKSTNYYARCVRGGFVSLCGDGNIDGNEFCDDGFLNGTNGYCTTSCNAIIDRETKQWGTASEEVSARTVAIDALNNIYVAGYTAGSLDGNTSAGGNDAFLTKWNANGTKAWTKQWGTNANEYVYSAVVDGSGNAYVTGYTAGSLDGNTSAGGNDAFLTKWNADGTKAWTKQWGTSGSDRGWSVALDTSLNIYVAGDTFGSLDGNTNAGDYDIFLTKWNANGTKAWTEQWGTSAQDSPRSVAIDTTNNIFVTGYTFGSLDGNTTAGGEDLFLTKWDGTGTKIWTRQWGTSGDEFASSVAIGAANAIFVTGQTAGDLGLDGNASAGSSDIFLTKWNSDGTKAWTGQWGSVDVDSGYAVAADSSGAIYIVGRTFGSFAGNTLAGAEDLVLTKWKADGTKEWSHQWGTSGEDRGYGVSVDASGTIYVTGYITGSLDGNTDAGGSDIFLSIITEE